MRGKGQRGGDRPATGPPVDTAQRLYKYRFKKGESGNPSGRPRGGRSKLSEDFLTALYDDFQAHGRGAIVAMRERDPSGYVKVIAQLLPKEVAVSRPLEHLSEEELLDAIEILQSQIAGATIDGERVDPGAHAAPVLQPDP